MIINSNEIKTPTELERLIGEPDIVAKGRGKKAREYMNTPLAFDIETTALNDIRQAMMYVWQFQVNDEDTIIGRTWEEFTRIMNILSEIRKRNAAWVIYVHNLAYEFQFFKTLIEPDSVLCADRRDPIQVRTHLGAIEWRCSYHLSGKSLGEWLEECGCETQKEELDYSVKRYPWTPLTDAETSYCIADVKGLRQAVKYHLNRDKDTLASIPLTSTGYVRREAKKVLSERRGEIRNILPDRECFDALRDAFRGGNTHANRYHANEIVDNSAGAIRSFDISSSYPSAMCMESYPWQLRRVDEPTSQRLRCAIECGQAVLMRVRLYGVRCNSLVPVPYIATGKALELSEDAEEDNGRILKCSYIYLAITEIDFAIIAKQYEFDGFEIVDMWTGPKKKLPPEFVDFIFGLYKKKTELKGKEEDADLYNFTKTLINGCYGMLVQNPMKPSYYCKTEDGMCTIEEDKTENLDELYTRYMKDGWLPYQWGVWCTAYARLHLQQGIDCIGTVKGHGWRDFLYCDTDSIKFVDSDGHTAERIAQLNEAYKQEQFSALDKHNERHYMNVFEEETCGTYKDGSSKVIKRFKTMGAKKYAYEDGQGLHLTISGVIKKQKAKGKKNGAEELGSLEAMCEGFTFHDAAGLDKVYNDQAEPIPYDIDGHKVHLPSNVYLTASTYTLGLGNDYRRLLIILGNVDISTVYGLR